MRVDPCSPFSCHLLESQTGSSNPHLKKRPSETSLKLRWSENVHLLKKKKTSEGSLSTLRGIIHGTIQIPKCAIAMNSSTYFTTIGWIVLKKEFLFIDQDDKLPYFLLRQMADDQVDILILTDLRQYSSVRSLPG